MQLKESFSQKNDAHSRLSSHREKLRFQKKIFLREPLKLFQIEGCISTISTKFDLNEAENLFTRFIILW